jgi:hypothetical protein
MTAAQRERRAGLPRAIPTREFALHFLGGQDPDVPAHLPLFNPACYSQYKYGSVTAAQNLARTLGTTFAERHSELACAPRLLITSAPYMYVPTAAGTPGALATARASDELPLAGRTFPYIASFGTGPATASIPPRRTRSTTPRSGRSPTCGSRGSSGSAGNPGSWRRAAATAAGSTRSRPCGAWSTTLSLTLRASRFPAPATSLASRMPGSPGRRPSPNGSISRWPTCAPKRARPGSRSSSARRAEKPGSHHRGRGRDQCPGIRDDQRGRRQRAPALLRRSPASIRGVPQAPRPGQTRQRAAECKTAFRMCPLALRKCNTYYRLQLIDLLPTNDKSWTRSPGS